MRKKNIFIVGSNNFNMEEMNTIDCNDCYNFISLLPASKVYRQDIKLDVKKLLNEAREKLDNFDDPIDGIIGFFDFPVTLITFLLIQEHKLNGPSLESGLKCEHKFLSRKLQSEVIKEHIPGFALVHPLEHEKLEDIKLDPPFWLKPVKSFGGQLGFNISDQSDLNKAMDTIRDKIDFFADPFNHILSRSDLPEEVKKIDGNYCIAETLIGGHQCTLSGYVHNNEVHTYGMIDSVNYPGTKSFFYYLLPSELPLEVQNRMAKIAEKVMPYLGFNNSPFNIEFYYDEEKDKIFLLEINPRMSQSHSDLYAKVTGHSNHQILVDLAQGNEPDFTPKDSQYKYGAKIHHRVFHDGIVKRFPDREELDKINEEYPDTHFFPQVKEGDKLSDLTGQDSYSYRDIIIYTGADSKKELMDKYHKILDRLDIQIKKTD